MGEWGRGGAVCLGEGAAAIGCRTIDVLGGTSLPSHVIRYWLAGGCESISLPAVAEGNASGPEPGGESGASSFVAILHDVGSGRSD